MGAENEDFKSESTPVIEPKQIKSGEPVSATNVTVLPLSESLPEGDDLIDDRQDWAEEQTQVLREEEDQQQVDAWVLYANNAHVKIDSFPFSVGRGKSCNLVLEGQGISRRHADILYQGGRYLIVDQQSLNGVEVNGYIVSRVLLEDGDKIKIGDQELCFTQRHPQVQKDHQRASGMPLKTLLFRALAASFVLALAGMGYLGYQKFSLQQRIIKLPILSAESGQSTDASGTVTSVASADFEPAALEAGQSVVGSDSGQPKVVAQTQDISRPSAEKMMPGMPRTKVVTTDSLDTSAADKSHSSAGNIESPRSQPTQTSNPQRAAPKIQSDTGTRVNPATGTIRRSLEEPSNSTKVPTGVGSRKSSDRELVTKAMKAVNSPLGSVKQDAEQVLTPGSTAVPASASANVPTDKNDFSLWRQQSINKLREGSAQQRKQAAEEVAEDSIALAEEKYLAGEGAAVLDVLSELENSAYLGDNRKLDVRAVLEWLRPLYGKFSDGERYYNRADKELAFAKWELFLAAESERFGNRSSAYAETVASKVVQEYLIRAQEAYEQARFHEAFALWQRAIFIDGNEDAKLKLAEMEMNARELYRKAIRAETVNSSQARRYWQEVINFVPPGTEYYTKAKAKLAWYTHWGE